MGLCGAVDTLASQASGAGLPVGPIFQRAALFLALHCLPISAAFVALPPLLSALGQPADVTGPVSAYLLALLPNLWLDSVARCVRSALGGAGRVCPATARLCRHPEPSSTDFTAQHTPHPRAGPSTASWWRSGSRSRR